MGEDATGGEEEALAEVVGSGVAESAQVDQEAELSLLKANKEWHWHSALICGPLSALKRSTPQGQIVMQYSTADSQTIEGS